MVTGRFTPLPRAVLALLVVGAALGSARSADAAGKTISTGIMFAGGSTASTTSCAILNTTGPLAPGAACSFGRNKGVYGGGAIVVTKGSPSNSARTAVSSAMRRGPWW